ncbi:MAG: aromatic amino acid DMT transporter YddG [Planctomycetes bacterium]|nr:aromatic amino acid DMT transporter YddG [Planctomycetota bacterium]
MTATPGSLGRRPRLDRATLCGLGAILLWSTTIALARSLTEQVGRLAAAAAAQLVAGALALAWLAFAPRALGEIRRLPRRYLLACGLLFVLYMLAFYLALGLAEDRRQALEVGLVNYLWCPLTILFSLLLLGTRARFLAVPGMLLALLGVCLGMTQGAVASWSSFAANAAGNPAAYSLAFVAALSWALYSNLTRRLAGGEVRGGVLLFLPASGLVLLALCLLHPEEGAFTARACAEAGVLGFFTAAGYVLWDHAMRKGDVVLVAACSYFTPLLATLVACAYLRVAPGAWFWAGCLLVVVGSFLTWSAVTERARA